MKLLILVWWVFFVLSTHCFLFIVGYGSRVDSSSMLGANERVVETEVARKTNEYQNSIELGQISELYEAKQVLLKQLLNSKF